MNKFKKYLINILQIIDDNAEFLAFAFKSLLWVLIIGWLSWEFWPFQQFSQQLAYSETVETKSAVMTKINVIEFQLDMDQQRVIQKVVAPIQGNRGKPQLCGILNISCESADATNEIENKGYREIWEQLPSKTELLSELENCTIKSSNDWICKSKWYASSEDTTQHYVGKSNGEWIFYPQDGYPYNWKISLAFDQFKCEGNICFEMSIEERKRQFKELQNMINMGVERANN